MYTKDIIHNSENVSELFKLIDAERYPHALLLKGGVGSGKLAIARALAQYLTCSARTDGESCGSCSDCHKSLKGIHPDIHFSFPITGAKVTCNDYMSIFRAFIQENPYASGSDWIMEMGAGKKTGNMTAAECNRLSHIVHLKPYEADKKVIIIWLPEYLGKEGNRLLKMIEEPPEETYFIFVSDQAELILGTILSRCQIINITAIPSNVIVDKIQKKYELELNAAITIANLSDGNINEAFKMSEHGENKFLPIWIQFFRNAYQGHTASISKSVAEVNELTKEEMRTYFQYCIHFLRQCLLLRYLAPTHVQLQTQELELAKKIISVIDDDAIQEVSTMLDQATYYLERNANMKLAMLNLAINIHKVIKRDALVA